MATGIEISAESESECSESVEPEHHEDFLTTKSWRNIRAEKRCASMADSSDESVCKYHLLLNEQPKLVSVSYAVDRERI